MIVLEERVSAVVDACQAALLGAGPWTMALDGLAAVTGSSSGQLIKVGPEAAARFDWAATAGGRRSPFAAPNGGTPHGSGLAVVDFGLKGDQHWPISDELLGRYELPYLCFANVVTEQDLSLGLSVLRSRADGRPTPQQRGVFTHVVERLRAAVQSHRALQSASAALVAGAMGSLSLAVFVCDAHGQVRAMSPRAESLAQAADHLTLRNGRLVAWNDPDTRALSAALREAALTKGAPFGGSPTWLLMRDREARDPLLVEVKSIPDAGDGLGVAALVVARSPRQADGRAALLAKALFGLTQAETAVAADLVAGLGPQTIAERAGVSIHTVRTHIKRVLGKAGVNSQLELVTMITSRL